MVGGSIIAYAPLTAIKLIFVAGTAVWAGILMGVLVVLMGLLLWFAPSQRTVASLLAIAFSIVSLVTSNLGGYFAGMTLGIIGGALGFAWVPVTRSAAIQRQTEPASAGMPDSLSMQVETGRAAEQQAR